MPTNADSICRKIGKKFRRRLYTLSIYIVQQNQLGSHLFKHWRTQTLSFRQKPYKNSIPWLRHPNLNHMIIQYRSKPCLNTLVGSLRHLKNLLKFSPFYHIVELYQIFLHCWAIPSPNTFLRYTLSYYIAKQFPLSIHSWAKPNPNTLFRYTQLYYIAEVNPNSLHCRAIPNPYTLLGCTKHYYISELYPILVHCRTMADLNILPAIFEKTCRQPIRIEYHVNQ